MAKSKRPMSRGGPQRKVRGALGRCHGDAASPEIIGKLCLNAREQQYIDSRIRDVEKAAERSRLVFIVASAISLLLISVAYNELWSWSRSLADNVHLVSRNFNEDMWTSQLILLQLKEWVAGLQFDLPYLGGRFGASDAAVVGGVLLIFNGLWCYYATRRENHLVYFLVKDIGEFDFSDKAKFYLSSQLFATQLFMEGRYTRPYHSKNFTDKKYNRTSKAKEISRLRSVAPSFIFFLPVIAIAFVVVVDIASLYYPSPLRGPDKSLYEVFCGNQSILVCNRFAPVLQRLAWSFFFLFVVLRLMILAFNFQRGTLNIINFTRDWKNPLVNSRSEILRGRAGRRIPRSPTVAFLERWILGTQQ